MGRGNGAGGGADEIVTWKVLITDISTLAASLLGPDQGVLVKVYIHSVLTLSKLNQNSVAAPPTGRHPGDHRERGGRVPRAGAAVAVPQHRPHRRLQQHAQLPREGREGSEAARPGHLQGGLARRPLHQGGDASCRAQVSLPRILYFSTGIAIS